MWKLLFALFIAVQSTCFRKEQFINECFEHEASVYQSADEYINEDAIASLCETMYRIHTLTICNIFCENIDHSEQSCVDDCVLINEGLEITEISETAPDCGSPDLDD